MTVWLRSWFPLFCPLLILISLPITARAATPPAAMPRASFNCGTATGVDEQVICSDSLLRQADHDLLTAYRAARAAGASPAYRALLKNDELAWILRRNSECAITKFTVITPVNRSSLVDCLLDQYAERIADLHQMQSHPATDPAAISSPIRRSFLATGATPPANSALVNFQLPPGLQTTALAWQPDGTLEILGNAGRPVYVWRANKLQKLPVSALIAAPATPVLTTADTAGDTLYLGPRQTGITPNPRFVTLITPAGPKQITPTIRIDSRFNLTATYAPFANEFIVAKAADPTILDYPTVRRWSKTNCLAYWIVSPKDAAASQECIPFGPYETAVPVPIATKPAVYLLASGFGLYQVTAGAAQPVLIGDFLAPAVSPDGCAIALFKRPPGAAPPSTVTVLSVCAKQ